MPGEAVGASAALDALGDAAEHTRRLFPVDPRIWVTLGFVTFLDQCGRRGTPGLQLPPTGGSGGSSGGGSPADWMLQNMALVVMIVAGILVLALALGALAAYVSSRGTFVYIDVVATGRVEVARPWAQHADLAWSHFLWRLALSIVTFALAILVIAPVAAVGFATSPAEDATPLALAAVAALPFLLAVGIGGSLLDLLMRDVVAPIQLHEALPCGPALRAALRLVAASPLSFAVYLLVKIVLGVLTSTATFALCCVTCCAGAVPVVMQTLAQPLFFFERALSLCFLRRHGIDLFSAEATAESATM